MSSAFLSYSHEDKAFARRLAADLRRNGHIVWIDEGEIKVGDSLIEKIRDGIDRVDYVIALISNASINSPWVKKELDIASNREMEQGRVVVLPAILDDVDLPGFLKGKMYSDFCDKANYQSSLSSILQSLGPARPAPKINPSELEPLKTHIANLEKTLDFHHREAHRRDKLRRISRSQELQKAIDEDNKIHPELAHINNEYTFECMGVPITIGYVFHAIHKASYKGTHVIEVGLTLEDKWDNLTLMLEAYKDYLELSE